MKKIVLYTALISLLLFQMLPIIGFSQTLDESQVDLPQKPYEKTLDSSGNWYQGYFEGFEGSKTFAPAYFGGDTISGDIQFETREHAMLETVFLGLVEEAFVNDNLKLKIVDWRGYEISGFTGSVQESMYIFKPDGEIFLEKGSYRIVMEDPSVLTGAYIISGLNYDAYKSYLEALRKLENKEDEAEALNEPFEEDQPLTQAPQVMNPMLFQLDQDLIIDEVIVNTVNGGLGAPPGEIAIADSTGSLIYVSEAEGDSFDGIDDGIWSVRPEMIFPKGLYQVLVSDMNVLSYTGEGDPLFYVNTLEPVQLRYDFTGTYSLDLETIMTANIMGPVSRTDSSFSLDDFEISVIDKGSSVEVVGIYEGMPFSQELTIIETGLDYIVTTYDFGMDLTGLPYKAEIGSSGQVIFAKYDDVPAQIAVDGSAFYKRAASSEKGEDDNKYSVTGKAMFVTEVLPPFVMTALGNSGGVGNIPGADNPIENATGLLFPPLIGVIGQALTEIIKKKAKEEAASKKGPLGTKDWYKKQYPDASDETIAMIMLADAMGSTDNPDEGDAVSVGDNESVASDSSGQSEASNDEAYEDEDPWAEDRKQVEAEIEKEEAAYEEEMKREQEALERQEQGLEEEEAPDVEVDVEWESKVIQTSANGATQLIEKDPKTGQWYDYETGNPVDLEDHEGRVMDEMAENKAFNDREFEKNTKGEMAQDKINREEMKRIKNEAAQAEHIRKLEKKYGKDASEIKAEIEKRSAIEKERFDKWQMIGDVAAVGEVGSTVVLVAADTSIDMMSKVVPGGETVKNIYKVTKNVAGTMADKGVNTGSFTQGLVLGVSDVGCDYIDNPIAKAAVVVATETAAPAVGGYLRGEDVSKEAAGGFFNGVVKATLGAATDGLTSGAPKIDINVKNSVVNIGTKIITNKEGGGKVTSSLVNEFVVKPGLDSTSKSFSEYFE